MLLPQLKLKQVQIAKVAKLYHREIFDMKLKNQKLLSLFLVIIILVGCENYVDRTLTYQELPLKVKAKFDSIFDATDHGEFIIPVSTNANDNCFAEIRAKFSMVSDMHLNFGDKEVIVPLDITAARIFVLDKEDFYYINTGFYGHEDGAKRSEYFDHRDKTYNVFALDK
jgi:hypothetical protein